MARYLLAVCLTLVFLAGGLGCGKDTAKQDEPTGMRGRPKAPKPGALPVKPKEDKKTS